MCLCGGILEVSLLLTFMRLSRSDILKLPKRVQDQINLKTNKFGARKTEYNGRTYDSKGEADFSAKLDLLKKAGEIKKIEYQFPIKLFSNGQHVTTYYIDFKVLRSDGVTEYIEFKGSRTSLFNLKWKMAKAQLNDKGAIMKLITKKGLIEEHIC